MFLTREGAVIIGAAIILDYNNRCEEEVQAEELAQLQREAKAAVAPRHHTHVAYIPPELTQNEKRAIVATKVFIFLKPVLKELALMLPWHRIFLLK